MKRPAFQFYPADWRKDVELQSCSMAAQGLWINAMCVAHECDPYGHLTVNGKGMNAAQLGRQVGLSAKEAQALLDELLDAGVARKTAEGVVYSKRMVADEDLRNRRAEGGKAGASHGAKGAEHGSKGGRPKADKGGSETPLDELEEPPPSSSSSPSGDSEAKASASAGRTRAPMVPCPYRAIVDAYHEALPSLPAVRLFDGKTWDKRCKAMREMWAWVLSSKKPDGSRRAETADDALAWLKAYFERAADNDFLMGRSARSGGHENWKCDLDFLLTEKGMRHVIEKTEAAA